MKSDLKVSNNLEDLLRRCVGCGLCLPHCATWAVSGNEVHSPRGRLLLLEDLLQDPNPTNKLAYAAAFDHCIGCRACETACPSGVPFSLLESGQHLVAGNISHPSSMVNFLSRRLDSVTVLNFLRKAGSAGRCVLRWVLGSRWRQRLDGATLGAGTMVRLLGSMPVSPQNDQKLIQQIDQLLGTKSIPASAGKAEKTESQAVAFFIGCANEGLIPESTRRLTELLEYLGCEIQYLKNQGCCGALADHTGRPGKAALLKRANSQSMEFLPEGLPVLVEAAGCGLQLKEYGPSVSEKIVDAAVFLSTLSISGLREIPLTVAYHDPCHGRHGQGIYSEPRKLLQQIPGLKLVEAQESEMCCGSGGAWGLHHQEMSDELGKRKARNLAATGADLVVTSNPGCLGQVADGLLSEGIPVPVLALTDLLWYAFFTAEKKN